MRGRRRRFDRDSVRIERNALVIVDVLPFVIILWADEPAFGRDRLYRLLSLKPLEQLLFARRTFSVPESAIGQHCGVVHLEIFRIDQCDLVQRFDRLLRADFAVERAASGVPFRDAYREAAESAKTAREGRTPESSLAARTSPGAAADLRLDELRERLRDVSRPNPKLPGANGGTLDKRN